MSSNPEESDKPIPLSRAYAKRRDEPRIETSASELEEILSKVVDKQVTKKIERLETSINRMVDQFEGVKNGDSEDSALRVTTDLESSDLALAGVKLYQEDYYFYTCGMLEEKLNVSRQVVLKQIQKLNLRGDSRYHKTIRTWVKSTSKVEKYSELALVKIKEALDFKE